MGPVKCPCYKRYLAISELVISGFPCTSLRHLYLLQGQMLNQIKLNLLIVFLYLLAVPADLHVNVKATLLAAVFLIVS